MMPQGGNNNPAGQQQPSGSGSSSSMLERTQSQYQRKLARQRQLEMMEAAASGTAPSMQLAVQPSTSTQQTTGTAAPDFLSGPVVVGRTTTTSTSTLTPSYDGLRSRETARRFLHDEEDDDDDVIMSMNRTTTTSSTTTGVNNNNNKGISAKDLFDRQRNVITSGNEMNLMDLDAAIYKDQTPSIGQRLLNLFSTRTGTERDGVIMTDDGYYASQDYRRKKPMSSTSEITSTGSKRDSRTIIFYILLAIGVFGIAYAVLSRIISSSSSSDTSNTGSSSTGTSNTKGTGNSGGSGGVLDTVKGIVPGLHSHAQSEKILRDQNTKRFNTILDVLIKDGSTPTKEFLHYNGPEYMALRWISYADQAKLDPTNTELHSAIVQRYALAVLYYDSYIEFQKHYGQQVSIGNMTDGNEQSIGIPNPGWKRKDYWLQGEVGYCKWYGVHCTVKTGMTQYNENGSVEKIELPENNVYGSLPKELTAFDNLLTLDLRSNKIDGPFPNHMGRLIQLHYLYLQDNQLSGSLPTDIGYLASLREIYMANNQLNSTIPIQMQHLLQLRTLSLENNQLTGNIPDLSNCNNLINLWINHNNMSGPFPFELAQMKSLITLHMNNNHFTGTIHQELWSNTNFLSLHLEHNQLRGTISELLFEDMNNLAEIHLDNNALTGSIPTQMQQLTSLHVLSLHHNKFNSTIPTEIGYLKSLNKLHLYNNELSGFLPTEIGLLSSSLIEVWLNDNKLYGDIPSQLGKCHNVQTLYLENNLFNGVVPHELASINQLKTIRIFGNPNIVSPIPDSLCFLRNDTFSNLKYFAADCKTKCKPSCCDKCYK